MNNLYKGVEYLRQYQGAKLVRTAIFEKIVQKLESCERTGIKREEQFTGLEGYRKFNCKDCRCYEECIDRFDRLLDLVHNPKNKQVKNIVHW